MVSWSGHRWSLGERTDQAIVGDWGCDGRETVAVLRPRTGALFRFDAWPAPGREIAVEPFRRVAGAETLSPGTGCGQLVVARSGGPPVEIDMRGRG